MSSAYCSSCKIELPNDDTIKGHYKSEFHRYNVKRKLVDLPPVSLEQFDNKKAQLIVESSTSDRDQLIKCEPCGKSFASKATYKQHLESKKHRENLKKFNENVKQPNNGEEPKEEGPVKTTAEDQNVCLFCNKASNDIEENLVHMRLFHSFFISELKHLKDLQGLVRYLGAKVHRRKQCIQCGSSFKEAKTGEGIQQHMLAKGHVFMNTEDFGEYQRFYDFSKVYENLKKQNLIAESGDAVIREAEDEEEHEEERSNDDEEGSWEVVEDEDGAEGKRHFTWKVKQAQVTGSGELMLPNGKIIGHRQYKDTYKQYYREADRLSSMENSQLIYVDDSTLSVRDEENRLMVAQNEIVRKERIKADHQAHKQIHKQEIEHFKVQVKTNNQLHFVRRDLM